MDATLLDTDMLSEILKKRDQNVMVAARTYLLHHRRFAFSAMTQYEVVRGMKSTGAVRQLSSFSQPLAPAMSSQPVLEH